MSQRIFHSAPGAVLAWLCLASVVSPVHAQPTANLPVITGPSTEATPLNPEPAAGQSTLTLNELIATVLANNTELLSAQQARNTAISGIQSASAYVNPRVEWQAGRNSARMPGTAPGAVQGWGVAQLIENPNARSARIDAADAIARGSEQAIAFTRNALVGEVRLRAAEYQLRRAEATMSAEDLALLEQVRERVRLRVASGEAPRYEIIKADAEIVHARERQQTAALRAEQVLISLNRLAAGRLPARWNLVGPLSETGPMTPLEELQAQAETDNPDVRALQAQVERADANLRGARASRLPGVDLRIGQMREPDLRQTMVGVSVQIPLLDRRDGVIGEASSERVRLQGRLDGRRAELRQQLRLAWQSLDIARLRAQALSEGVVVDAEAALKVARAAYQYGERGILDVLDAQRVLRSARANLLEARFQEQAARIELESLAGRFAVAPNPQP